MGDTLLAGEAEGDLEYSGDRPLLDNGDDVIIQLVPGKLDLIRANSSTSV